MVGTPCGGVGGGVVLLLLGVWLSAGVALHASGTKQNDTTTRMWAVRIDAHDIAGPGSVSITGRQRSGTWSTTV